MSDTTNIAPLIGSPAPPFTAQTTRGTLNFPADCKGEWVLLFSHPADFTPICTTEFVAFARRQDRFKELGCRLVGLSVDSIYAHIAWLRRIEELTERAGEAIRVRFATIADQSMAIASAYGMVHPGAGADRTVRSVFMIDPKGIVRAIMHYPPGCGRSTTELERLLVALRYADEYDVATPADWQLGDDVIIPPPKTAELAQDRVDNIDGYECRDWFMCLKKCPHGE